MYFYKFLISLLGLVSVGADLPWIDPWCGNFGNPHTRMALGEATRKGEVTYQVQILWYWDLVCGGSLIQVGDTQAVLTTASCVSGPDPFFYSLQASDWNIETFEGDDEQLREVDRIYFPDNYDKSRPYENDIAIITFNKPFELNNLTQPIALPPSGIDLNPNKTLLATGWGEYHPFLDELTCKLQKVDIPQVDSETCQQIYNEHGVQLSESMFCIGIMDEGEFGDVVRGPCGVDFGGPLVDVEAGYLAGIMSYNPKCAFVGSPAVSTKVSSFVDWIESTLNDTRSL